MDQSWRLLFKIILDIFSGDMKYFEAISVSSRIIEVVRWSSSDLDEFYSGNLKQFVAILIARIFGDLKR